MVENAWIREAPPNMKMLAGYLVLHNHAEQAQTLVGASSEAFAKVEIHRSETIDGVARMSAVAKVDIAAGGQLAFAPGGYHLMLIDPVKPLKAGDEVALSLKFAGGESMDLKAEVKKAQGAAHDHEHHSDMEPAPPSHEHMHHDH